MSPKLFHFISTLTCYFNTGILFAQAPNWQWAKSAPGNSDHNGQCVTSDSNGFVYVAGEYFGTSVTFGNDTLMNTGPGGVFIVKYDSVGNVIWAVGGYAKGAAGFGQAANGITIDANGNLVVVGEFSSDSLTFDNTVLLNSATNSTFDIFLARYDTSGNFLSAISEGGNDDDRAEGVASDANGNIYVTGSFESPTLTFGTSTLTNSSFAYFDLFVVKFDNNGNVVWAKKAGGTEHDDGASICVDTWGDVYVTGWFRSPTIVFGSTTFANPSGWNYGYVVKYDSSGNILWAKRAGDACIHITTDGMGYIFITGEFSNTFTFDTITLNGSLAGLEMFVVKYDLSGNAVWARGSLGTAGMHNSGYGIATDPGGNVFVTGIFSSDSITLGNTVIYNFNNTGDYDLFVVKYDNSGNNLWARSAGGDAWDISYGISCDANGNAYITGYYQSTSIAFDSTVLTSAGGLHIFTAKLGGSIITSNSLSIQTSPQVLVYPNPISHSTAISFSLSKSQKISLSVYDVSGRSISMIADATFESGENELVWNADEVNAGIYFLHIKTENNSVVQKLIVQK